jgi:hypothetical protein
VSKFNIGRSLTFQPRAGQAEGGGGVAFGGAVYNFSVANWATFGHVFPQGAVPAGQGVKLGAYDTQNDIKVAWPDGSARHIIVTAKALATGNHTLALGTPVTGTFSPTAPSIEADLTVGGSTWTATHPGTYTDLWLNGPLVKEGRVILSFSGATGAAAHLRLIVDLRTYNDGADRVDVTLDNSKNLSTAGPVFGSYVVRVAGSTVLTKTFTVTAGPNTATYPTYAGVITSTAHGLVEGDYMRMTSGANNGRYGRVIADSLTTNGFRINNGFNNTFTSAQTWEKLSFVIPYLSRARKTFLVGLTEAQFVPDLTTFWTSGATFRPYDNIRNATRTNTGYKFDMFGLGDFNPYMAATGGRPDIGINSGWINQYLKHKTWNQREYMVAMANAMGSWATHITKSDETPHTLADSNFVYISSVVGEIGDPGLQTAETGDAAHFPAASYIPYLVTGDRILGDEMIHGANVCHINGGWDRGGQSGWFQGMQVRGQGWGLREVINAYCYAPDGHSTKAHWGTILSNNHTQYTTNLALEPDPLGGSKIQPPITDPHTHAAQQKVFMFAYFAMAFIHAQRQGVTLCPGYLTRLATYWNTLNTDWAAGSSTNWRHTWNYSIMQTTVNTGVPFASTAALLTYQKALTGYEGFPWSATPPADPVVNYAAQNRLLLMMAVALGLPNAQTNLDRLMAYVDGGTGRSVDTDLSGSLNDDQAGNAIEMTN